MRHDLGVSGPASAGSICGGLGIWGPQYFGIKGACQPGDAPAPVMMFLLGMMGMTL